jgi:hypothetical protein
MEKKNTRSAETAKQLTMDAALMDGQRDAGDNKKETKAPKPPTIANFSDEELLAEAERRGILPKPAVSSTRRRREVGEEQKTMTSRAWEIARELAKASGRHPKLHLAEAWEQLKAGR